MSRWQRSRRIMVRTASVRTGGDTAADEAALPFLTITPKITPILRLILLNRCNLLRLYCSNSQHHQAGMTMRRLTGPLMLSAWMINELQKQPKAFWRWHCDNISDLARFNLLAGTVCHAQTLKLPPPGSVAQLSLNWMYQRNIFFCHCSALPTASVPQINILRSRDSVRSRTCRRPASFGPVWLSTRIGKHINLHVHWHAKTCVVTALNTKRP